MYTQKSLPLLSWSRINLFEQCQRCFYKELLLQMKRPDIGADRFSLSNVVDELWKKELDVYRMKQIPHPLLANHTNNAVPLIHESLDDWRNYKRGLRAVDSLNDLELYGVVDDILINDDKELIVIDYKTTANPSNILQSLHMPSGRIHKRQVSFYAFLLKENGFKVNNEAFIVYSLALNNYEDFNQILNFKTFVLPYQVDYSWIENTIKAIRKCLNCGSIPKASNSCKFCSYELTWRSNYEN